MNEPYYAYIFVRQDISPEQQLVQFGHVSAVLGQTIVKTGIDASKLYFVAIGVPDLRGLRKVFGHLIENRVFGAEWREPDINNEVTALASYPVKGSDRELFASYRTLRFNS